MKGTKNLTIWVFVARIAFPADPVISQRRNSSHDSVIISLCFIQETGRWGVGERTMAQHTIINFEAEIHVVERSDHLFTATIMPFHVTGYSDTSDGSIDRAEKGLGHLLGAYETDGNLVRFWMRVTLNIPIERVTQVEEQVEKAYDDFDSDLLRFLNESNAEHTTEREDTVGNSSVRRVRKQFEYAGSR